MAGETFKLNFKSNNEGIVSINEPIGFDSVPFTLKQKSKGYGRDVFFGGDEENKFKFVDFRNHYLETFLYYFETYGWEGAIQLIIEKDGIENIIGDFALQSAETDLLTYLESKVVQDNNQALLKRRSELNVNLFSESDIDGNEFSGLSTENILVKSKPITKKSSWEVSQAYDERLYAERAINNTFYYAFNPAINLTSFGVDDSLTFFQVENVSPGNHADYSDFQIIEAKDNLRNIKVDISNLDLDITTDTDNGGDGYIDIKLELRYGDSTDTAVIHQYFTKQVFDGQSYSNNNDYTYEIPFLSRGQKVWLYYYAKVRQSSNTPFGNPRFEAFTTINSMNVDVTATRITYNTIVPSVRLYDAISQVVKSTSRLKTSFPFAEPNGEMYNQRIFNGNLLRNLKDRAFNLSLDKIEKWLPEINGDYEVNGDVVYFGLYKDFYQNKEIGVFDKRTFDTYKKYLNPRYAINQFNYKYKKYQSQKENEEENSFDISHGETQWHVQNGYVENKKEINVEFVRDTFLIDEQRRKAIDLNNNTSTSEDETVFILDTRELNQDLSFTETDFLKHTFDESTNYLKITNTGNFNFELLGLAVGEDFTILNDVNAGVYEIVEATSRYIVLNNGQGDVNNNGERITEFTYIVSTKTAPYISWSNEGFSLIDGIVDKDDYANLRYTIKRNIKKFYNEYLATCNLFAKKPINNTLYRNNGELTLNYEGELSTEKASFIPSDPILSPYMHEITVITDFNTYMDLQNKIKSEKGFIRTFDAKGHVIKLYNVEMTFQNNNEQGELKIKGEEKFNKSLININTGEGYLVINEGEYLVLKLSYEIKGESVLIMDEHGLLMYNPVFWQKVTVNGANFESKAKLEESLKLLI